jgi:xylulose-5-phosphate/fructose-6-phosphate phosphoketolase
MDAIDRLPPTGERGLSVKRALQARLVEHKRYIDANGQDLPEIRNWKWST